MLTPEKNTCCGKCGKSESHNVPHECDRAGITKREDMEKSLTKEAKKPWSAKDKSSAKSQDLRLPASIKSSKKEVTCTKK